MTFTEKYPAATQEVLHFPLMFSDSLGPLRVGGLKYATLDLLYDFAAYFGIQAGTVRTNLSRMKKAGAVIASAEGETTRYRTPSLQLEVMRNVQKRHKMRNKGFLVAVYSFEKEQEKERVYIRGLLEATGFVRFAQNAYITLRIDAVALKEEIRKAGLAGNIHFFPVDTVDDEELALLARVWKVQERAAFLKTFFEDLRRLLGAQPESDADSFNRMGAAWIAFIVHVYGTEPPLPDSMLGDGYPYEEIYEFLRKESFRHGKEMLRHYVNRTRR